LKEKAYQTSTTENVLKPTQRGENSGTITLNGPAARKVQKRRYHYYYFYATMEFEAAKTFKPWVIFPNENDNSLT
jgi:aspartate 1-decarboxylase